MNDHELDRLVATATHVRDGWVDDFDLRAADDELLEEIMATTDAPVPLGSGPPDESGPPPEGPSPFGRAPRPHRRFTPAVAVGAAAALVVGVVVLRSTSGDGGSEPGDVGTSGDRTLTPMIADPVPEGFEPIEVSPEEGSEPYTVRERPGDALVYGDVTATALSNDVVIRVEPGEPDGEGTPLGEPVAVRGQQGVLCWPGSSSESHPHYCDFGNNITGVRWPEPSGQYVSVESRTFDRAQVLAIAEGLLIDGDRVELGDVPAGVRKPSLVAELDSARSLGFQAVYAPRGGPHVSVTTRTEDEATRVYNLWRSGPRDDEVQGHPATVEDIDGSHLLTWSPAPGQLVEVLTNGLDEAAARNFAESVRPATAAEWATLQEQAAARPDPSSEDFLPDPPPEDAVRRELAGGDQVWGWIRDDGWLCYGHDVGTGYSGPTCTSQGPRVAFGVSAIYHFDEPMLDASSAVGVAPEGTASIDGGETTFGEQVDGGRLFVWESTGGETPGVDMLDTLVFRDAQGNEVGTLPVEIT